MNGSLSILTGNRLNFGGNAGVLRAPGNSNTLNHFGDKGRKAAIIAVRKT